MKNIDLSIIIVAYNSTDTIVGCVNSILETTVDHSFEIIISDNSENEETKRVVLEHFKDNEKVIYIHNDKNYGFSKGNNIGIKKSSGKYLLFLNPDTKMYLKTIDGMVEFAKQHPDCGAATCYMKLPDGSLDDASHRGFPTPFRALSHFSGLSKIFPRSKKFGGYNLTYLNLSKTHEIDALAGSFMIVPREIGEKLGWWDEDFFFYGEDIDFCYRIKEVGYKVYFVPQFEALHMKGVSSGIKKVSKDITKASDKTKKLATYHRFRAMEIFYDKHYKDKYNPIVTGFVKLGIKLKKLTA